ncbi:hypothetical protein SCARD494_01699 [Seiridium cardinale]
MPNSTGTLFFNKLWPLLAIAESAHLRGTFPGGKYLTEDAYFFHLLDHHTSSKIRVFGRRGTPADVLDQNLDDLRILAGKVCFGGPGGEFYLVK